MKVGRVGASQGGANIKVCCNDDVVAANDAHGMEKSNDLQTHAQGGSLSH